MRTIFITISQSSIIKNVLRSGGFKLFTEKGYRLVVFITCKYIPDYLKKEFEHKNVVLVQIPSNRWGVTRSHKWLFRFFHYFIWSKSTVKYFRHSRHFVNRPLFIIWTHLTFLRTFSLVMGNVKFLRLFFRWIDYRFFPQKSDALTQYFEKHKPDMLFATSISATMDTQFLKEARRRGVVTVSMPKTWDTLTKKYLSIMSDYFLVQNDILKEQVVKLQDFPEDRVSVIGFPEFDWYPRKDIIRSKAEHMKRLGLDPKLPVIFFGSQGSWYPKDYQVTDMIYEWVKNDELVKPCQMIVRPHFLRFEGYDDPFKKYKSLPRVAYDNTFFPSDAFHDLFDPTNETMIEFVNTMYHSDIVVIVISTLALDAVSFDKPIINAFFGSLYRKGKDVTSQVKTTHYDWVLETKATTVVYNKEALKSAINDYLENPKIKAKERELMRERLCYKLDGKSSERMVNAIEDILLGRREYSDEPAYR
jgi:CDP-glycerol glycerophosphotransferase (TagB/SpsB family)